MAVVVLSGISTSCISNFRIGSNVSCRKCMCGVGTSMASSSSSSLAPAAIYEPGQLFQNLPVLVSVHEGASSGRSFRAQGGAIYCRQRLSSRRSSHRQDFGGTSISWTDQRGARLKFSATKDSSRDVFLQTDPGDPQVSHQRLTTTRSGEAEEDTASQTGEADEKETGNESLSEGGKLLNTVSNAFTSEADNPATKKEKQQNGLGNSATIGTVAAGLGFILVFGGFGSLGVLYKDQLNDFLIQFSDFIEGYGPSGYGLFVVVYAFLELLAIPAIPLTMSSGLLFGVGLGTVIVSVAGTIAATIAFLIARYLARNRLLEWTKGNKKFRAIDKAIGADGFRVVTLLRLSPLLPFSVGNYLYGLTSVELVPYVLGSWLGMLPGSWAYVSAGAIGRTFIIQQESESMFSGKPEQLWALGLGIAVTVFAATYVTRIAKEALKDIED